jgi:tRNA (cmo5U34)-methyltransferase
LPGPEAKQSILHTLALRVKLGAPLIVACNQYHYASQPLLLAAWADRWRMQGTSHEEVQAKLGKYCRAQIHLNPNRPSSIFWQ